MTSLPIDRRAFLAGGALLGAGAALAGCTSDDDGEPSRAPADLTSWPGVRGQFALDPQLAHFSAFVLAPHPASVRAAIERWREALDEDPEAAVGEGALREERVRETAGRYLGVAPNEIALTDSTTMGLGLVYHGLRLAAGDHLLTSEHDFYSTHEALRLAAERSGARLERIALYDDPAEASVDEMVARVREAVTPTTRVVALTWVHSSTGVKIPVREIADALAGHNDGRYPQQRALLCLDAVHGLGAEDAGPADLGCDVFISGTHKWLFGPRGTGVVHARREAWQAIAPIIPSFGAPAFGRWFTGEEVPFVFGLDATPGGYHSFEHRWALAEAFEFHLDVGPDRVAARTRELATRLKDGLSELSGVRVMTPHDPAISAGIVCCRVIGHEPASVVEALRHDHRILASVTPYREQLVRFGPSIVTTPEQVDDAVAAVAELG